MKNGEPILIEANIIGGSIWLLQMAHGVGPFGDKTEEVLNWINFMRKIKSDERSKYKFGNLLEDKK